MPESERQHAADMLQQLGVRAQSGEDPQAIVESLSEKERQAVAIELAARRQATVVRDHRAKIGRANALAERLLSRAEALEQSGTITSEQLLLGKDSLVAAMRDMMTALEKAIRLERQAFRIDEHQEEIKPLVPAVPKRGSPLEIESTAEEDPDGADE